MTDLPADVDVAIIGAGFSGLGTAIRLRQEGYDDFVVLERGDDIGGTWHFNTYPGCGCDVPSHLYSFSFAPNPDWTRTYSRQGEIRDYLHRTADRFGIRPYVRTGTTVESAAWDEEAGRWTVETDRGTVRARMLIAGMGPLTQPRIPDIAGLDSFEGDVMHSARWDHDIDLRGKRVASIGTGASAIQYVPSIQPDVEQLHVFQRTPPWILPHTDRPTSRLERHLYRRFPALQRFVRGAIYTGRESNVLAFVKNPKLMGLIERLARSPLILPDASYGTDDPTRRQLAELAQRAGVSIEPQIEVEDAEAALELAWRGFGDTIVARGMLLALGGRLPRGLGWVPFAEPLYDTFAFISRTGGALSPATREFLRFADARLTALADTLATRPPRRRLPGQAVVSN